MLQNLPALITLPTIKRIVNQNPAVIERLAPARPLQIVRPEICPWHHMGQIIVDRKGFPHSFLHHTARKLLPIRPHEDPLGLGQ